MSTKKEKLKVENRQEGVFYGEEFENDCCDKCHDVTFEKTYPAHTAYHACMDLKCPCHQSESIEWMEEFDEKFGVFSTNVNKRPLTSKAIKDFISQAITTAVAKRDTYLVEEARKEIERLPIFPTDTANGGYRNAMEKVISIIKH